MAQLAPNFRNLTGEGRPAFQDPAPSGCFIALTSSLLRDLLCQLASPGQSLPRRSQNQPEMPEDKFLKGPLVP